jgi:hypothetical protein
MATTIDPKTIRRDLFSVKVRCGDNGTNEPVHEKMFRSMESAQRYRRERKILAGGYTITVKVVHPAQWVVELFTLCQNKIED